MKKHISFILAMVMVMSMCITAFAGHTTTVTYVGQGTESYEITVPGSLAPGSSGDVEINGAWASNSTLTVSVPNTITLTNNLDGSTKILGVTFDGISQKGDNTKEINIIEPISVDAASGMLFGTWTGTISYTVSFSKS